MKIKKTIITILHDVNQSIKYVDKVILLKDKKKFFDGNVHDALSKKNLLEIFNIKAIFKKNNGYDHIIDIDTKNIKENLWN